MSISSQFIERVENAVYHEPYMIPNLLKESKVKTGFIHSRFRRYVPHRVGIEFECFGDFANQFLINNNLKWKSWETFEQQFNLIDFSQDTELFTKIRLNDHYKPSIGNHEEVRVSIRDYRQLNGLYNILKEMAKYCTISDDCGIHIHIDLTKHDNSSFKEKAVKWFNNHLSEVETIFPKYTGSYNKRKADIGKGSWINLSHHGTVEFRIAPLTFDYELLITWIVKCSKLVSRMIKECCLSQRFITNPKSNEIYTTYQLGITSPEDPELELDGLNLEHCATNADMGIEALVRIIDSNPNIRDNILATIINRLYDEQVETYINRNIIHLTYPDGVESSISIVDAIEQYLRNGVSGVIDYAGREVEEGPRVIPTDSNGATTNSPGVYEVTSGTYTSTYRTNLWDYRYF